MQISKVFVKNMMKLYRLIKKKAFILKASVFCLNSTLYAVCMFCQTTLEV
jgi:hypothetical protein